jgi:sulfur relay (sulfurtransferase) complex TusBCD TusD component (DsrE family)
MRSGSRLRIGFASATADAALDVEVRLADDAVSPPTARLARRWKDGARLRARIDLALYAGCEASACPTAADVRGIREEQVTAMAARQRKLAVILVDVAGQRRVPSLGRVPRVGAVQ